LRQARLISLLLVAAVLALAASRTSPASAGASGLPTSRNSHTCVYYAGTGNTRLVVIFVGESARRCRAFARALGAVPFYGHVSWPKRCMLIDPFNVAVVAVLTPNAAWGRAVCALFVRKGFIR
jgi:hypothetical protein